MLVNIPCGYKNEKYKRNGCWLDSLYMLYSYGFCTSFWASGLSQIHWHTAFFTSPLPAGEHLMKPTLLLTPIMLLQLSATVTKITKQRKPAPVLSETSC